MTLTAYPNSLSFSNIETEFGGLAGPPVAPATRMSISLSNYYSGGTYVPANTIGGLNGGSVAIPTSGAISVGNFHNSQKAFVFNVTYSGTRTDTNARADAIAAGWNQTAPIIINCTVATGAILQASTTANYGLQVYGSWPSGSVMNLTITSGSYILGKGGQGGGGEGWVTTNGGNFVGAGGGPALIINIPTAFINNGVICGGGGGGGGGYWAENPFAMLGGGGGGGGNYGGGGLAYSGFTTPATKEYAAAFVDSHTRGGDAGGLLTGGAGGAGGYVGGYGNNRFGYGGGNGGSYAGAGSWRYTSYSPDYYDGNGNPGYHSRPWFSSGKVSADPGAGGYSYYGANYVTSYTGSGAVHGSHGGNT